MTDRPSTRAALRRHERGTRRRRPRGAAIAVGVVASVVAVAAVATVAVLALPRGSGPEEPLVAGPLPVPSTNPAFTPRPLFDGSALSIDDPTSLWVVVNKQRPLDPLDYAPGDLVTVPVTRVNPQPMRAEAAARVVELFDAFEAETGLRMQLQSAYRPFAMQRAIYTDYVASRGQEYADISSARPGHSEHQTGLVIDISALPASCTLQACFADTPQGLWLAENAWRFGFILRYPEGMTDITGYKFEPWHYRYVGDELAAEMHERGIRTLEEFFDLGPAPTY